MAAVGGGSSHAQRAETYKMRLSEKTHTDSIRLDWRGSSYDLDFMLPNNAWIDDLELLISAYPEQSPPEDYPIMVSFNYGEPIKLMGKGRTFDARIKLDTDRVKPGLNHLRLTYQSPDGQSCIGPSSGGWEVSLKDSQIVAKTRTRERPYHLMDVKSRMMSPLTRPKRIKLSATGAESVKLKALAAQGAALNMGFVPDFTSQSSLADMEIHIGTRRALAQLLARHKMTLTAGAQVSVIGNTPIRLVITGDDEAEVMDMAKAFARYEMPATRRRYSRLAEFVMRKPFLFENTAVSGRQSLGSIGTFDVARSWSEEPRAAKFRVVDPMNAKGRLELEIQGGPLLDKASTMQVNLNDYELGVVPIKRGKSKVRLDVPRGLLHGMDNELNLKPNLIPKDKVSPCDLATKPSGFAVLSGSDINIIHDSAAPAVDLSRLTASGYPFSVDQGAGTQVIFTASTAEDAAASYKVMSQLALAYGSGLSNANYSTQLDAANGAERALLIGPNLTRNRAALKDAPPSLFAAIDGRTSPSAREVDAGRSMNMPAVRMLSASPMVKGGVAALYTSPAEPQKITGVLTNSRGQSFRRAMNELISDENWNKLEGSIVRWDDHQVMMVQTAQTAQSLPAAKAADQSVYMPKADRKWTRTFNLDTHLSKVSLGAAWTFTKQIGHNVKTYFSDAGRQARREFGEFYESMSHRSYKPKAARKKPATLPKVMPDQGQAKTNFAPTPIIKPPAPQIRSRQAAHSHTPYKAPAYKPEAESHAPMVKTPRYSRKAAARGPMIKMPTHSPQAATREPVSQSPATQSPASTRKDAMNTPKVNVPVPMRKPTLAQYKPKGTAMSSGKSAASQMPAQPKLRAPNVSSEIRSAAGKTQSAFKKTSSYVTRKIDNYVRPPQTINARTAPKAQALIFALIGIAFMLLIVFARPFGRG